MAKRFTDTEKWKKKFVRRLPLEYKVLWLYLCDECDYAGVWDVDMEVASLKLGHHYDEKAAADALKGKVLVFDEGNKWYLRGFPEFQYTKTGRLEDLNMNQPLQRRVYEILNKHGLWGQLTIDESPLPFS